MNSEKKGNDTFANIAKMGINNQNKNLVIPQPPRLEEIYLSNEKVNKKALFTPVHKMNTREELYQEVAKQKAYYRPFFQDLAPQLEETRIKKDLVNFDWRIGTDEDAKNFIGVLNGEGSWQNLDIPHFGEPRGVATTYYRTTFEITEEEIGKGSLWIYFKAVDYKAHVFINGALLGSHEGMFAPFEFDFTRQAHIGENTLVVMVENDYICMSSPSEYKGEMFVGDKLYAATGLGYDDPLEGWHHCPAGMGIYQDVFIEARNRIFVKDIFVRPILENNSAEAWLEIDSCDIAHRDILIELSLYGQNFDEVIFEKMTYKPETYLTVGVGDSLTEARVKGNGALGRGIPLRLGRGVNYFKIPFTIDNPKLWELNEPWLYQLQVRIIDENNHYTDAKKSQFGMRSFVMEEDSNPKGKLVFNGREIRLRGANTMGHEQQCVFKKDWEQLLTDLVLAKVCNMNFLRLTQRPVQPEIYEYCDKLGLMIQTDLPLFGSLRRNQFVEAIKQTEEMEHLIRGHACTIMVSYINEPFPNAQNRPHRCLERKELEAFFESADRVVKLLNPDRVIKRIDGDYDPSTEGLPDNHCYPCWYNGHGIDIGRLNKGYWMQVKPGWHYGCGEFGIEGMEEVEVMRKYYPEDWLPHTKEEETIWSANKVIGAQTGSFHYFFYETPRSLEDWVKESQKHQSTSVTLMTNAYRRDCRMNTFAYHLFIDAFPDGWMKTIMDVDRNPKPAYFAYREALTPLMSNIRTDRYKFFEDEEVKVEAWICNDTHSMPQDATVNYQIECENQVIYSNQVKAKVPVCSSKFQGFITFKAPKVESRTAVTIRLAIVASNGEVLHDTEQVIEVFKKIEPLKERACILEKTDEKAIRLVKDLQLEEVTLEKVTINDVIIVSHYETLKQYEEQVMKLINEGVKMLVLELPEGEYEIAGKKVKTKTCGMLPLHFASRDTGHSVVDGFKSDDIKYWYDEDTDYMTPILEYTIQAQDAEYILTSGNVNDKGEWDKTGAVVELEIGKGVIRICQIKLPARTKHNPIAKLFTQRLLNMK